MLIKPLKKNNDFQIVYHSGTSFANRYLVMYIRKNELTHNRLGISVSKKVGNSVIRHRTKRLIKESYRLNMDKFQIGYDIVVIARNTAKEKTFEEIESALLHVGKMHKIVKEMSIS